MLGEEVLACKGNTKELYRIFNKMTGSRRENPLPIGLSEEHLANTFSDFFMDKIITIHDSLAHAPKYMPQTEDAPHMSNFLPYTEDQVHKIILSMLSKS